MMLSLKEAADRLLAAKSLILTAHVHPDGDAVGSSLALAAALKQLGKSVRIIIDDDLPSGLKVLPGFDRIERPTEGQSIQVDLLVVLDTEPDRTGNAMQGITAPVLNIDHHVTIEGADNLDFYVDGDRAATAEIMYQLLEFLPVTLTRDIAMPLYTGLATDTGFFRFSNTTPFTMRAAAKMLECGVKPNEISESLEARPYEEVIGYAKVIQTIERFADGHAAGIFLDKEARENLPGTDGLVGSVRVIEGVDVAIVMKWSEDNAYRVSLRSKGVDVSRIAASFGGGGHVRAAGCTLRMSFADAKSSLQTAITAALQSEEQA